MTIADQCYELAQSYLQQREDVHEPDILELALFVEQAMDDWLTCYDKAHQDE